MREIRVVEFYHSSYGVAARFDIRVKNTTNNKINQYCVEAHYTGRNFDSKRDLQPTFYVLKAYLESKRKKVANLQEWPKDSYENPLAKYRYFDWEPK